LNPVLFEINGPLPDGKYLLGRYRWSRAMRLSSALLTCRPPASTDLTLVLEVGGVLTGAAFTVKSGGEEVTQSQALNVVVPANASVRWKAVFSGAPENAASNATITLQIIPDTGAIIQPTLVVTWANGSERLPVFSYDAPSHTFSPLPTASGRVTITNQDSTLSITIQNTPVLFVSAAKFYVNELQAMGGTATPESPRLEFQVGGQRIATLTKSGVLLVAQLTDGPPPALSPTDAEFYRRFEFYSHGVLTAVLSATGLTALNLEEPLPS
jgi:hypothetical protein